MSGLRTAAALVTCLCSAGWTRLGNGKRERRGRTHGIHQLLDFLSQHILALDGGKRDINFLRRNASRVREEVSQVIRFLELDFALQVCHCACCSPGNMYILHPESWGFGGDIAVAGLGLFTMRAGGL